VWQHTNVTAGGSLIATYDTTGLHFYLNDALGTRRAQTDGYGVLEQTCQSLPFGDGLNCSLSNVAPTEHHFTGKERDAESGLDYFGARYYASNMGRWMSPDDGSDWNRGNPQSLNLYSYGHNNPLSLVDPDGHTPIPAQSAQIANAIAQDRTLHAVFNAANNFSPRGFENAFNSGALNNLSSAQGNTLRGLAGEAQVIDDINGSLLQNLFGGTRDRAMVGSAGPSLPGAVPDVFVQYQNVGLANGPATTLQNVATGAGIGDVSIPGSVTMNFLEVKSGISASSIGTGVDQAIATAGAINSAGLGGSAISTLVVDAGAWGSLSAARQASYVGRMSAAGAYIQVQPGLADAAKQRAQNMVDRAK
jgi:RHS repeat-associated protein